MYFKFYVFSALVYAVVVAVLGMQLCAIKIPRKKETYKLRVARRILSISYFILAIPAFIEFFRQEGYEDPRIVQLYTLIVIAYEAILFTATLLTMIHPNFVTAKRVVMHLIITTIFSVCFTCAQFAFDTLWVYFIALGVFFMQLAYYVMRYRKKYDEGIRLMEQYYDEDLKESLSWTHFGFYTAILMCVVASMSALLPFKAYTIMTMLYVLFYAWFANRFLNYVAKVNYYIPAVTSSDLQQVETVDVDILGVAEEEIAIRKENLKKAIDEWVAQEKFTQKEEGKEEIAKQLGTDSSFLVWYFRNEMKQNFRPWRVNLRIELAKKLLRDENFSMSMNELSDCVGFSTKSNFYGYFKKSTGVTPVEYRKNHQ